MATPKQPPPKPPPKQPPPQQPAPPPPYTERLQEAIGRFNAALESYNAWNTGYREIWRELVDAARMMRACGVSLPPMPGEQMQPPAASAPIDEDAAVRAAIKESFTPQVKPPVTSGGAAPKTTKE
jgi:hypothetical protein